MEMFDIDTSAFEAVHNVAGHSQWMNWAVIFLGQYLPYVLVAVFLYFILSAQRRSLYVFSLAALSVILSRGILTEIIYSLFFRARPFVDLSFIPLIYQPSTSPAFPSGHMAFLIPIGLSLWQLSPKKGAWFLGLTAVVGLARVAAGVHWPSDIIGGIAIGAVSFALVKYFFRENNSSATVVS